MSKPNDTDWLDQTLGELNKINVVKDMLETLGNVQKNEKIIGTITGDYTKKLFILANRYQDEFTALMQAANPSNIDDMILEINKKHKISKLLMDMFWISVHHKFGDNIGKKSIGLRENWTVITFEGAEEECYCLEDLLQSSIIIGFTCEPPDKRH